MTAKPQVTYDGATYTVRRASVEIPDLDAMPRLHALVWLNQNTYAKVDRRPASPNLSGLSLRIGGR